ncbi:MAG TPA: glutathione S-transferase family protein [Gammaproteobacteria bacterium]|nr:glutathione S-transferase family protein [Gammaproteobacteria bacterium]
MSMDLTLHYAPDNASLAVRLTLQHRDLPYRTALVNRATREHKSPSYLRLNPNGLIPVLETPEGVIFETGAILLWLADRYGKLGPAVTETARGDFLKWLFFLSNTAHADLRISFYPEQYMDDEAGRAMLRRRMQARFSAHLDKLELLAGEGRVWFGGDRPSVLDFYLVCLLRWRALYPIGGVGDFRLNRWPALDALARRMEALPATAVACRAEGLGPAPFTAPRLAQPPEGSAT